MKQCANSTPFCMNVYLCHSKFFITASNTGLLCILASSALSTGNCTIFSSSSALSSEDSSLSSDSGSSYFFDLFVGVGAAALLSAFLLLAVFSGAGTGTASSSDEDSFS